MADGTPKVSAEAAPGASRGRVCCAWVLPLIVAVVANLAYMCLSWFPNHSYLEWAEARPQCQEHLPDLFLDLHEEGEEGQGAVTQIADLFPMLGLLATGAICLCSRNLRLWNRLWMTQSFVIVLNCAAEQCTVIPSSYGYRRCKAYMGISGPAEDKFSFSPTGSCVAMIWSGHVFHTMLSGYMMGLAIEERYPAVKRLHLRAGHAGSPHLKSVLVVLLGVLEMFLLVLDKGHYSVDMFLAILISMLIFTNPTITYWAYRVNPFFGEGPSALCVRPLHPGHAHRELEALRAKLAGAGSAAAEDQRAPPETIGAVQEGAPRTNLCL